MDGNLIKDTQYMMRLHNLSSVSIFCGEKNLAKSTSAALALALYMNKAGIKTNIVIESREGINLENELFQEAPLTDYFLAISVDAKKIGEIENNQYQKSNIILNVYGPINTKGFGILNYVSNNVCGAAEIIYYHIHEHAMANNLDIDSQISTYLYISLLSATKCFTANIKENTFTIAKELLRLGMDYKAAAFVISKKPFEVLKCQELILKEMKQRDNMAYTILNKKDGQEYTVATFATALDSFRNIGNIFVWVLFIENDDTYDVILQGNKSTSNALPKIARRLGLELSDSDAHFEIQKFDIHRILNEIDNLVKSEK